MRQLIDFSPAQETVVDHHHVMGQLPSKPLVYQGPDPAGVVRILLG